MGTSTWSKSSSTSTLGWTFLTRRLGTHTLWSEFAWWLTSSLKLWGKIRSQYFSGRPCTWQLNPGMRTSARCCWAKMLMSTGIQPESYSRIVSLFSSAKQRPAGHLCTTWRTRVTTSWSRRWWPSTTPPSTPPAWWEQLSCEGLVLVLLEICCHSLHWVWLLFRAVYRYPHLPRSVTLCRGLIGKTVFANQKFP